MIKSLMIRVCGLILAVIAFPPALVSLLKGVPPPFSTALLAPRSLFWRWLRTWMPAIHYPILSWNDVWWSLPGILAVGIVGVGLAIAFGKRNKPVPLRWEDEP